MGGRGVCVQQFFPLKPLILCPASQSSCTSQLIIRSFWARRAWLLVTQTWIQAHNSKCPGRAGQDRLWSNRHQLTKQCHSLLEPGRLGSNYVPNLFSFQVHSFILPRDNHSNLAKTLFCLAKQYKSQVWTSKGES